MFWTMFLWYVGRGYFWRYRYVSNDQKSEMNLSKNGSTSWKAKLDTGLNTLKLLLKTYCLKGQTYYTYNIF